LQVRNDKNEVSRIYGSLISILIFLVMLVIVLESVPEYNAKYKNLFRHVEFFFIAFFAVEYLLRFYACGAVPRYRGLRGRLRWFFSFGSMLDFWAIMPALVFWGNAELLSLQVIRLFWFLRLTRYNTGVAILIKTFRACRGQLLVALSGILILLFVTSCGMYYAEREAQPEKFGTIPDALWCAAMTLTSVGYGDTYPVTDLGKALTIILCLLGIGIFAIPTGVITANFIHVLEKEEGTAKEYCPHCGKRIL